MAETICRRISDFVIIDKRRFAEWIFKSDSGNRLLAELKPVDSVTHTVIARTEVSHKILEPKAGVPIAVSKR